MKRMMMYALLIFCAALTASAQTQPPAPTNGPKLDKNGCPTPVVRRRATPGPRPPGPITPAEPVPVTIINENCNVAPEAAAPAPVAPVVQPAPPTQMEMATVALLGAVATQLGQKPDLTPLNALLEEQKHTNELLKEQNANQEGNAHRWLDTAINGGNLVADIWTAKNTAGLKGAINNSGNKAAAAAQAGYSQVAAAIAGQKPSVITLTQTASSASSPTTSTTVTASPVSSSSSKQQQGQKASGGAGGTGGSGGQGGDGGDSSSNSSAPAAPATSATPVTVNVGGSTSTSNSTSSSKSGSNSGSTSSNNNQNTNTNQQGSGQQQPPPPSCNNQGGYGPNVVAQGPAPTGGGCPNPPPGN